MTGPVPVYQKRYQVGLGDIDFRKKLKISALFNYFQDIASLHAENLGVGIDSLMNNHGVTWVLTRIRVDLERIPVLGEDLLIETWPQPPGKLEFDRDFLVRDASGNELARVVSTWVIMDIAAREIKKTETITRNYPFNPRGRAIDCRLGRFKAFSTPEVAYQRVIGYSDVDINEHLNSSKYIDFIMDCFSLEEHRRHDIRSLEISYLNEALSGDRLTMYKDLAASGSGLVYIEGCRQDNTRIFKAQLAIRPSR